MSRTNGEESGSGDARRDVKTMLLGVWLTLVAFGVGAFGHDGIAMLVGLVAALCVLAGFVD
ncbi:hypothetical protein [Halocalculus aciditolerans]|uniref:Uncharacterized protein n=1 Tax=Halocalculus aciditolerans TaxID=1383812 RepID=A0A830EZH5_9EURY|nr:hypothetical protein [Halocalculus aciditolerans]GGL45801.1 hypothetical protein GCM10009039_00180 [Halocalculus aciditolerans]